MPTAPSAFPLLRAPQAPGDKPNPPEGGRSLGGRPPEAEGNYPAAKTHSARSVPAASTAGRNATQQLEKHSVNTAAAVFDARPTLRACMAQGLFYGGTGRRAVAHTRPEFAKNALGPVGLPLVRGDSGAGQWTQPPSKGGKSLGGKAPWGRRKLSRCQDTLGQIRASSQHGRPKCDSTTGEAQC